MVRKVSLVTGLVLGTEPLRSLAICERDSLGIVSRLVERRVLGDEAQFVGLDSGLLREVGPVPGMSDFLDRLILIYVILV